MLNALRKFADAAPVPTKTPASGPIEGNALIEALVCEFHWTALQIGAITCCMNASLASRRTWMLRACTNLVPVESPVVRLALRSWQEVAFPRDLAAAIGRVYFELADAKKIALPLVTAAGSLVAPPNSLAKLHQIAAVWRKLAEECAEVVQDLEPEARWRLAGLYTANTLVLGRFLQDAIKGEHACIDRHGNARLPLLPQRRRMQRYDLKQPCRVLSQTGVSIAFARDVSRTGMGLDCEREFKLKEAVAIELKNGRTIRGIIVWCRNGKAGVQFDSMLPERDSLLSG